LTLGDPIARTGSDQEGFYEYMDVAILDEDRALMVGQGGFCVVSLEDGEILVEGDAKRAYGVSLDGGTAWLSTRTHGLYALDVSDPLAPTEVAERFLPDPVDMPHHEAIAYSEDLGENGLIALAWRDRGVPLFDPDDGTLGWIEAESATGVALWGDRLLVLDAVSTESGTQPQLVLYSLVDLDDPEELARVDLGGTGRDVVTDGTHVAVALGGEGAEVFTLDGDELEFSGALSMPGFATRVALDGDDLWIAAWEVAALAWLGEGGPVIVGHETADQSAMSVGARDGRALVGDWKQTTALQRVAGVGGPELVMARSVAFQEGDTEARTTELWNGGAFDLSLDFEVDEGGYAVSQPSLSLAPGERALLVVEPPETGAVDGELAWTSDDPDELTGHLKFTTSTLGVGSTHSDFSLPVFTWPDTQLDTVELSDFSGKVVFLAYWADF